MQRHAVAAGRPFSSRESIGEEFPGLGVIAEPALVGSVGHPQDALGIDLWVAEALAILRRRSGRRIEFGEFKRLGIKATDLAGALGYPGIAVRVHSDVVRFGVRVDERV